MVWDTLFATDANLQIKPQMVDKYTVSRDAMKYSFTLRDGLSFHDGAPVTSEDCVASLIRWGKKDPLGKLMFAATGKLQADRQEELRARAEGAVRPGPGGARQALEQRAVHHARPPGRPVGRRAGQGADRLRAVQVRQGRVAAGQPGGLRAQRGLRAAERAAQRRGRRQARLPRPRGVALHAGRRHGGAARSRPARSTTGSSRPPTSPPRLDQEPGHHHLRRRSGRPHRLAASQSPASAVQQQEGAPGAALHGRPGDVPAGGHRPGAVLPHLPGHLLLRQGPVRDQGRRAHASRPRPSPAAHEGVGLRRPAGRRPRPHRPPRDPRHGTRHAGAAHQDRRHRRSAGGGLEHAAVAPGQEGPAQRRRLEYLPDQLDLLRRAQPRGQRRRGRRRRERLVRLVLESARWRSSASTGSARPTPASASSWPSRSRSWPTTRCPSSPGASTSSPRSIRKNVRGVLQFPAALLWNVWLDA